MSKEAEEKKTWIFTFGCGHNLAGYYQRIVGTYESARAKMVEIYGDKWAFQYSEEEWNQSIERHKDDIGFMIFLERPLEKIIYALGG